MFWLTRLEVATNNVYHTATITKVEGWFFVFLLEWLHAWFGYLIMKLPNIPTKRVDEDGEPWEVWQDWYWCKVYNPTYNRIYGLYKTTSMDADLDAVPREWHEWDFEVEDEDVDGPRFKNPETQKAYELLLAARDDELRYRKFRLLKEKEVLQSLRKPSGDVDE